MRAAVGDAHDDVLAIAEVRDLEPSAERISTMSTREAVVMDTLTTCRSRSRGPFRIKRSPPPTGLCIRRGKAKNEKYSRQQLGDGCDMMFIFHSFIRGPA